MMTGKQGGFTLLEAIVAMVLLATSGIALFSWMNSILTTTHRLAEVNTEDSLRRSASEFVHLLNPMLQPKGQIGLGSYSLSWDSRQLEEAQRFEKEIYKNLYRIGLYDVRVVVEQGGVRRLEFHQLQTGFRQIGQIEDL